MPNIREQSAWGNLGPRAPSGAANDQVGCVIVGSDGREAVITKARVQTWYQSTSGNAAARRAATVALVLAGIEAALGVEQFDRTKCTITFDVASQTFTFISVAG